MRKSVALASLPAVSSWPRCLRAAVRVSSSCCDTFFHLRKVTRTGVLLIYYPRCLLNTAQLLHCDFEIPQSTASTRQHCLIITIILYRSTEYEILQKKKKNY